MERHERFRSQHRADVVTEDSIAAKRARLNDLDAALARLRAQYDVLINAFKFDEAKEVSARIETNERERQSLAEGLPPLPAPAQQAPYAVARRRRR
jgi:hypothetical protein